MSSLFKIPIDKLKGVGSKRAQLFKKLQIFTVGDILRYYPRSYEDWSNITPINRTEIGQTVPIKAMLCTGVSEHRIAGNRLISRATVYDESGAIGLVFFNNKFIKNMLKENTEYYFFGKITQNNGIKEMMSPAFLLCVDTKKIHPIYSQTAGLTSRQIEAAVAQAIKMLPLQIKEPIPQRILDKYSLCTLQYALNNIHFPKDASDIENARKRLVFEELLILNLGLHQFKSRNKEETALKMQDDFTQDFFKLLPFRPTNAQLQATKDCVYDMQNKINPMNRLLQGDVGSGKTAVATALCYSGVKNGWQTAFMAPTEILAEQHFNNITKILKDTDIKIDLLTGALTQGEKRKIKERLKNGEINLIIGTHALISEGVEFSNLGLVITDEQHRFGVGQRAKLISKGNNPHLLVMSATPIPRTLALIMYGDLDISIIDELPPGRQKIKTYLVDNSKRYRMYGFLKKHIDSGRQVYIVCPLVEENDMDLASVETYEENIKNNYFSNYRVGLLHGKMKAKQKNTVMEDFKNGNIDILVATTVIEVGVDVPNATIMVIENAERFGLSQLHQLRGRVGRGNHQSFCILVSDSNGDTSKERLQVMCNTDNGFEIADSDLQIRGPGDFFGRRQHGLPELKIANFADTEALSKASEASAEILRESNDLSKEKYRGLHAEIKRLFYNSRGEFN